MDSVYPVVAETWADSVLGNSEASKPGFDRFENWDRPDNVQTRRARLGSITELGRATIAERSTASILLDQ